MKKKKSHKPPRNVKGGTIQAPNEVDLLFFEIIFSGKTTLPHENEISLFVLDSTNLLNIVCY